MRPVERVLPYGWPSGKVAAPVPFTFDGKRFVGREGDTLAAALLANGVDIVGRSFKLHRPRGLMGWGVEEPNGLLQLEAAGFGEPNVRATLMPLYPGLKATGQNAWPSVKYDALGILDRFHRMFPASFYYKSMMWPSWHFYERFVRPIAGLGRAPDTPDAQKYQKRNIHCDLLVVGGGPSGLCAALAAAKAGLDVILADDREAFGGSLPAERLTIDGEPAVAWVGDTIAALRALPNVRLLSRTNVSGYYENNFLVAAQRVNNHLGPMGQVMRLRERLWRIRAKEVILATGAIERPLTFMNNDRPGIMLASAVRGYLNRHGVVAGRRVVVVTNNDDAYRTAFDLMSAAGAHVTVVDTRSRVPDPLMEQARLAGVVVHEGCSVRSVMGRKRVKGVRISRHEGDGRLSLATTTLACDLVAMSGGWTPTIHLFSQAGGTLRYDEVQVCLVPDVCRQALSVVGAAAGAFSLSDAMQGGERAGLEVTYRLHGTPVAPATSPAGRETLNIEPYWFTRGVRSDKQWLDFQYDVKVSDIELALRENFVSVEHVKRYTTGGMSVDQGKSSNFNILGAMAAMSGKAIMEVGTTRFRPPYQPATLGTFAGSAVGERYAPWHTLPAHAWHVGQRAHFGDYGWQRPEYYPRDGEDMAAATLREVLTVRHGVGLFDGSPLGKIEISGPDAATFLNRMYVNNIGSLKPRFARYAMLANENGVLIDDGVIVRLSDERFLVHATSGAVGRVALMFEEYLQCEWPELQVHVNNVTTQWANVTVSGPKARAVLETLESDIDFSAEAFAHMQFRQGQLAGLPARILRASFTGEVTYEISVSARYAVALWAHIHEAGRPFDIAPYGIEALEVMRTEKGYLHIGADTDGCTNPLDIGWGSIISKKSGDFVGRRSLQRPGDTREGRLTFVGVESVNPRTPLPVGGHFVGRDASNVPSSSLGYVTSACISPMLDRAIGLGILSDGQRRMGEIVQIYANGRIIEARVVPPTHFDPRGERLNG